MIKYPSCRFDFSVSAIALMICLSSPVSAAETLSPRAEVNVRAGTERSILMTEFWAPLAQQSDRVLYGDLRLMGDDGDNREGNLGFGYRQISSKTNSVLGGNIWIDRRRTENGNNFHQLALGLESLGDKIDLRANGYIQLNSSKTRITPNIGSATPYLAGTGIFYDTNGSIVEEPQDGFDAEIGYRLPILQKYVDAARVYAGGYHFFGDTSESTTGFRLRVDAQVNSIFSVGARFQHDDPRGSQGFLEATLRFPFKSKKLYQEHGLRSRLDESPERDIDIVTGAKVDTGLNKQSLNTSGTHQRILYVDNTNTNAGDGSKENPFNTLKAAEAALQENDILYVNRGDGTTTGQEQGIVINKANVQLIGSGSALTYGGYTLLDAGMAPVITNTAIPSSSTDYIIGNGILITGRNTFISGITVNNAQGIGIFALADGQDIGNIKLDNVTTSANHATGIYAWAINSGSIDSFSVLNSTSMNNISGIIDTGNAHGVMARASDNGHIGQYIVSNNVIGQNRTTGIVGQAISSGSIIDVSIANNTVFSNGYMGVLARAEANSLLQNITISNNISTNNGNNGISIGATGANAEAKSLLVSNNITNNNIGYGLHIYAISGRVDTLNIANHIANNNVDNGILVHANSTESIISATISNSTTNNNSQKGLYVYANNSSQVNSVAINNHTANNNEHIGIDIYSANTSSITNVSITNSTANNNTGANGDGFRIRTSGTTPSLSVTLTGNTANGNAQSGYKLMAAGTTGTYAVSMSNNNAMNNTLYGLFADNDAAATYTYNVDLGGGSLGSTGGNRIYNNISVDVYVDTVPTTGSGTLLYARNNWWGVNTGLATGRRTLEGTSTIDATAFLTTDPRP